MDVIEEYQKNYINSILGNYIKYYLPYSAILFFLTDDDILQQIKTLIDKAITNHQNIKIYNENMNFESNTFTNHTDLKQFIIVDSEKFNCEKMKQFESLEYDNAYMIYIIYDKTGKKQNVKNTLQYIKNDKQHIAFVLAESKLNGKTIGENRIKRDRAKMISSIVINMDKLKLGKGVYSAGAAFFEDYAELIWLKVLEMKNNEYNNEVFHNRCPKIEELESSVIQEIYSLLNNGYKQNITFELFKKVICNDIAIPCDGKSIEKISSEMYGDAIAVYIQNQKQKINAVLSKQQQQYFDIVNRLFEKCNGNMSIAESISSQLKNDIKKLNKADENIDSYLDRSADVLMIKEHIYKCVCKNIAAIKYEYFEKGINMICNAIEKNIKERKQKLQHIKENIAYIHDTAVNRINEYTNITDGKFFNIEEKLNIDIDNYKESICSNINKIIMDKNILHNIINDKMDTIVQWMIEEAEVYCKNDKWSIAEEKYIVISSMKAFQNDTYKANMNVITDRYYGTMLLKYCKIDIKNFIQLI